MESRRISHWVIESKLGEGGMGEVWKARHETLRRHYAIKVMSQKLLPDPQFEARFIQEAGAQARLQHPHIVGVSDFFLDNGVYYLVMPYIEGQSLEERMAACRGPLPLAEALRIAQDVLLALDYAHQQAVIHRDVKPSNILLDRSGHAYLVDFGIALMVGQERKTRTGASIGTPHYMSPEQIIRPRDLDHRADVYSFGCVLYEMLTGRPPFEASLEAGDTDFIIKDQHVNKAPLAPRSLNSNLAPEIETMVLRALAKNANERFSGCGEFARALAQFEKGAMNLIYCPSCGSQNRLANPETIARERCGKCGKPFIQETPAPAPAPPLWTKPAPDKGGKVAMAAIFGLLAFIFLVGWVAAGGEASKAKDEANRANNALEAEKSIRTRIAEKTPLIITEIKLRNEDGKGKSLSDFTTSFNRSAIRYIDWYIKIQNSFEGIKSLSGKLGVKYIKPDGSLYRGKSSPPSFTEQKDISVYGSDEITSGWGNDSGDAFENGVYRIEFWWEGKKVGETSFNVDY